MQTSFQRIGRWLWLPAIVCCIVGAFGLADFPQAEIGGKLWLIAPHLGGVVITALGGYRNPWAGVIGVVGSALMAGLSWWNKLDRQTEGFEWQFNNSFGGALCLVANFAVLSIAVSAMMLIAAMKEQPDERTARLGSEPDAEETVRLRE